MVFINILSLTSILNKGPSLITKLY